MGEKKRFLDRVLRFMGIEEEDLASERTDQADNGADAARVGTEEEDGRARVSVARSPYEASRRGRSSLAQVIPVQPTGFNDVQAIADSLLAQKPVLVDLEELDGATARRVLDFLGGTVYALAGHVQKVRGQTFLFSPGDVDVDVSRLLAVTHEEDGYSFRS